ncbi:Clp protease N-terminal domain-containing protein [Pseudofrankia sp. DC12]|uniref:Clp protease N-terminal domain-containing protein n=1 Tax=Pseudofrankia sp. DC12 TaxID=683315 RepID=UPI0018DEA7BE|nr:Clp protease N-terminal domain-containing protein [Pseudofrankia sp. DC12]
MESLEDLISSVESQTQNGAIGFKLYHASFISERLADLSDRLILHFVQEARESNLSWTYIGQSLGVTKQAAQQRFGGRKSTEVTFPKMRLPLSLSPELNPVMQAANAEAFGFGHELVGTEHLVLGLLSDQNNSAAKAINGIGVPLESVRDAAKKAVSPARERTGVENFPHTLTPRAQTVITVLMIKEAQRRGHSQVLAEDLLMGILGDDGGIGAAILLDAGIEANLLREWLG